jgi:hypothetical protein
VGGSCTGFDPDPNSAGGRSGSGNYIPAKRLGGLERGSGVARREFQQSQNFMDRKIYRFSLQFPFRLV